MNEKFHLIQRIIDTARYTRSILLGKAELNYVDIQIKELEHTRDFIIQKLVGLNKEIVRNKFDAVIKMWNAVRKLLEKGEKEKAISLLSLVIEQLSWILTKL